MIRPNTFKSESRKYTIDTKKVFSLLVDLNEVFDYPNNFITLNEGNIVEEYEHDLLKKLRNKSFKSVMYAYKTPIYDPTYSTDISDLVNNVFDVVLRCYDNINDRFEGRLFMSIIVGDKNESVIKTYPLNEVMTDPTKIYELLKKYCLKLN